MIKTIYLIALFILTCAHLISAQANSNNNDNNKQIRTEFTYILDEGYPIGKKMFGNIAGVDVDKNKNVIIFHRGSHRWDLTTFDVNDVYQPNRDEPIREDTVVVIDPQGKKIVQAWGRDLFFMPHGLSLDQQGQNIWLTDVALHQVFKYSVDGSKELMTLGVAFVPGNDDAHFCKPTSVADTGEFIFVADGYCNSRIAMFSAQGRYLGEFGQSSEAAYATDPRNPQPTFNIPHKIVYAKEAKMLCVADRENGRIQCFTFEPKETKSPNQLGDNTLVLNGAITIKYIIADPLFNGRLFSLDYSPYRGGILVAVSGESPSHKPPLGFVYNATTGVGISRFSPPAGRTFGMAHDLAIHGEEANSLFVVDISPVNLWKFSRSVSKHQNSRAVELTKAAGNGLNRAISIMRAKEHDFGFIWYLFLLTGVVAVLLTLARTRRFARSSASHSFSSLYSNSYPTSINSLFGGNGRFPRRTGDSVGRSNLSTMFSRRAFFNMFDRSQQQQSDFSRIPMEDSDNSDDDKSDSDVEEFNINHAASSVKINV